MSATSEPAPDISEKELKEQAEDRTDVNGKKEKADRTTIETKDGEKLKVNRRLLAAESLYFRNLFTGPLAAFNSDAKTALPFNKDTIKSCICYIEDLNNGFNPRPDFQTAIDIYEISCFLLMENVRTQICKLIVETVDSKDLVDVFHMALSTHPPLAKELWPLIIRRFRKLIANFEYTKLDDVEMSTALKDNRLNIFPHEESDCVEGWLNLNKNSKTDRVNAILQQLPNQTQDNGRNADYVSNRVVLDRMPRDAILAIGGCEQNGAMVNTLETYNYRTNRWVRAAPRFNINPMAFQGSTVVGGNMLFYGGFTGMDYLNQCSALDLTTGTYRALASMLDNRCYLGSTSFTDSDGSNFAFAVGGFNGLERHKSAEMYSFETGWWSKLPDMSHVRSEVACAMVGDKLFAIGGFDGSMIHGHCEMFDFGAQKWIPPANCNMSKARCAPTALTYDTNILMVLGGYTGGRRMRSVEIFDIREGLWHDLRSFFYPRTNFGAAIVDEKVFVAGGFTGREVLKRTEVLDLRINRWKSISMMTTAKSGLKLVPLRDCELIGQLLPYNAPTGYERVDFPPYP